MCYTFLSYPVPASLLFFILFHTTFIPSHILLGELITFLLCFCSLSSARMFRTLIAFCRRNTEVPELLFAATGRSTKISRNNNDIVCCNISYGLIFFNFLSTHGSPHFHSTHLNQEHKIIKDLQWGALFTRSEKKRKSRIPLHTHIHAPHTYKSDNRSESSKWNSLVLSDLEN